MEKLYSCKAYRYRLLRWADISPSADANFSFSCDHFFDEFELFRQLILVLLQYALFRYQNLRCRRIEIWDRGSTLQSASSVVEFTYSAKFNLTDGDDVTDVELSSLPYRVTGQPASQVSMSVVGE